MESPSTGHRIAGCTAKPDGSLLGSPWGRLLGRIAARAVDGSTTLVAPGRTGCDRWNGQRFHGRVPKPVFGACLKK